MRTACIFYARRKNGSEKGSVCMKTDIQIAQEAVLEPISDVAASLGLDGESLIPYGKYKAKVDHRLVKKLAEKKDAKVILVTAISPTPAGEGKTTTSVGLADAMNALGKKTMLCLREPSLGPVFGIKGGAAGGGYAQVVPMEDINLHFTGDMHAMGQDMAAIGGHFDIVAVSNLPWIIVAIVASFAIMAMGVSGGIEKANKVMMPILFFLFVGLGIYIAFLPGASDGYKYIFKLDPKGLANPMVWIFAFGQAFFSLSVAGNGSVIYGSYLPKKENIPNSARNVAVFDTLAALLAAFVIIPAMAAGGAPLEKGGPGLMFVWLVNVLNGMPGGRIIGVIFFVCVLFAGLSSIINLYEAPVATLQDNLKLKRVPATAIILVIGCVVAVLIQKITSEWMDVVSIYICPLGALLAGIMFFWVAGKKFVLGEVNDGLQKPIGGWFYPLAKYVYCILCIVALVAGAALGGIG